MAYGDDWNEQSGIPSVDEALDPLARFKRRGSLRDALGSVGQTGQAGDNEPAPEQSPRLAHRVNDDSHTAGNRSGGPAGAYADPNQSRLKDLVAQEQKAEQPTPKPSIKQRLLRAMTDVAPTLLASAFGGAGGAVGADQRMEEGVKRRQSLQDIESQRKNAEVVRLKDAIERETEAGQQREFQHGEDILRQQTAERGLNERARLAEEMETGRNNRLVETIKGRSDLEGQKQEGREEIEDTRQRGRMELQMERRKAQEAVARIHQATAQLGGAKIPPLVGKAVDTFQDSQSRMDVMQKAYDAAIKDPGNQQAQLNLLANHLGMTMGLQKGARLNQAIIEEAKRSGYLDERVEAHFGPDGYMTGVVLTPRQMRQMVDLAQDRLLEDARKVNSMESYFGVQGRTSITPRIPPNASAAGAGTGGGAGGAGAASASAPKTAEDYLKKRRQAQSGGTTATVAAP